MALTYAADGTHELTEQGYDRLRARHHETLFTLANGYMGVRGSLEEGDPEERPGLFVAGVFDSANSEVPEIPNGPNPLGIRAFVDGEEVSAVGPGLAQHTRTLNLANGTLTRNVVWKSSSGAEAVLEFGRMASVDDPHLLAQRLSVTLVGRDAEVAVEAWIDWDVSNSGRRHWDLERHLVLGDGGGVLLTAMQSRIQLAQVYRITTDAPLVSISTLARDCRVVTRLVFRAEAGRTYKVDKMTSICTSRDRVAGPADMTEGSSLLDTAEAGARRAAELGYEGVLARHAAEWHSRWERCRIAIRGDEKAQAGVDLALFHLLSCAAPFDERVSIGARGLHGEGYRGHVFWDTEIFIIPFFTYCFPEYARALLMYRYNTLAGARAKAREAGYQGAMFAWESTDTGEETCPRWGAPHPKTGRRPRIWCGDTEHHISADVAYAVWQYWTVTGDLDFLLKYGAEVIIDTGRFWASRASLNEASGRYEIPFVIGPDEYHENVDNNTFTNYMAKWNIEKALELMGFLERVHPAAWERLKDALELDGVVRRRMQEVAAGLYVAGPDPDTGVITQFDGYMDLADADLSQLEGKDINSAVLFDEGGTKGTKLIKQPDVLMLLYLHPELASREVLKANWDYYEPRCSHGSSLSAGIHSALAARLGDLGEALRYLHEAVDIDLSDKKGNSDDGIHAATLGSIWQAIVLGFGGLRTDVGCAWISPRLPAGWNGYGFAFMFRGVMLRVEVTWERVEVAVAGHEMPGPVRVRVYDKEYELRGGEMLSVPRS